MTKCSNLEKGRKKVPCTIPTHIKEKYLKLAKYNCKVEVRAFKYVALGSSILSKLAKKKNTGPKVKRGRPPPYNFTFALVGIKDD